MDQTERIIDLLTRRLSSPLTEDEIKELEAWMSENPEVREALSQRLSDPSLLGNTGVSGRLSIPVVRWQICRKDSGSHRAIVVSDMLSLVRLCRQRLSLP